MTALDHTPRRRPAAVRAFARGPSTDLVAAFLTVLLAALLTGCGGVTGPSELRAYKRLRFSPAGEEVAKRLPKLTGQADARFAAAQAEEDAGHAEEAAHLARLATYQFLAADAYSQRKVQQMRLSETTNRQRLLDERLADARRRERNAVEALERTRRLTAMHTRAAAVGGSPHAARLATALAALELAYTRDAARLAPADELQAVTALDGALNALSGRASASPEAGLAVDRAVLHTQRLLADVTPRFEEEKRRSVVEARLRELLGRASRVPELEARLEGRGLVLTLRQLFADGTQTLMPHRVSFVDEVAALVADAGDLRVRVEGHTEVRSDAEAAVAVSAGRAATVRERLEARGVPAARLESVGRGGAEPVADNRTKDGRTRNRRIEVVLLRAIATPAADSGRRPAAAPEVNRSGDRAP